MSRRRRLVPHLAICNNTKERIDVEPDEHVTVANRELDNAHYRIDASLPIARRPALGQPVDQPLEVLEPLVETDALVNAVGLEAGKRFKFGVAREVADRRAQHDLGPLSADVIERPEREDGVKHEVTVEHVARNRHAHHGVEDFAGRGDLDQRREVALEDGNHLRESHSAQAGVIPPPPGSRQAGATRAAHRGPAWRARYRGFRFRRLALPPSRR